MMGWMAPLRHLSARMLTGPSMCIRSPFSSSGSGRRSGLRVRFPNNFQTGKKGRARARRPMRQHARASERQRMQFTQLRRREFISLLGGAAAACTDRIAERRVGGVNPSPLYLREPPRAFLERPIHQLRVGPS